MKLFYSLVLISLVAGVSMSTDAKSLENCNTKQQRECPDTCPDGRAGNWVAHKNGWLCYPCVSYY